MESQRAEVLFSQSEGVFSQSSDLWTASWGNRLLCFDAAVLEAVSAMPPFQPMPVPVFPNAPTPTRNADIIADAIHAAVDHAGTTPDNSPKPSANTMGETISLIGTVKDSLLGEPDVDTLNGEINLTWNKDAKQIILICFSGREPLVHHHQRIMGRPSEHGIEKATTKSLANWLEWLHGK